MSEPKSQQGSEKREEIRIDMKDLIKQRGTVKMRLTKFKDHIAMLNQSSSSEITKKQIKELGLRLGRLQALLSEFDAIQTQIEMLSTKTEEQIDERDIIESQFYSLISAAQEIIDSHSSGEDYSVAGAKTICSNQSSCNNLNNIKLPTIKLPSFDGNYLKWLEFRDTFGSIIHSNESIPEINKFHYLRSSLEGAAVVVIKSIEFTSQNYKVAWDLLCERYDNKKILINNHLKALFNIDSLTRESHKALRFVIDQVSKNLRALNSLGLPTDYWDVLIIYFVTIKLDPTTLRKWEEYRNKLPELPSLLEFLKFLRDRAVILETMQATKSEKPDSNKANSKTIKVCATSAGHKTSKAPTCPVCHEVHRITECIKFQEMSLNSKLSEVLKLQLCSNCLRRGHKTEQCRLGTCQICKQKHNTLLHKDTESNNALISQSENKDTSSVPSIASAVASCSVFMRKQVLLCTALVKLTNKKNNKTYLARALLDAGSQSCFISENIKNKLGLTSMSLRPMCISGVNNIQFNITDCCELTFNSLITSYSTDIKCLVIPEIIGNLPNNNINPLELNIPGNIHLADPEFHRSSQVDLLLGADIFFDIITSKKIRLGDNKPILQSSKLGWLVAGPIGILDHNEQKNLHCNFTKEINKNLTKFWELEELPSSSASYSENDHFCEKHFVKNTSRLENGRFNVKMPFCESPETSLGDSYNMALKRFQSLERKFIKNPTLKKQYCEFIDEYEKLGHLSKVDKPVFGYFMPHHAIFREKSETTKVRVVFDCSAKSSSGKSLNDIQFIGPVIQDELISILIRFRQHKFVLSGDITKMYRQIRIDPSQRHLQLIVWRDDVDKPLEILQLNTVTYGTASAPFLSTRCLLQLAKECDDKTVSEIIQHDFYYDDFLSGADTEKELSHIYHSVKKVLASGCFPIHKFRTNCPQIFDADCNLSQALDLNKESSVLGLWWFPDNDHLQFSVNLDKTVNNVTKRSILSNTCKIFDPLGMLSACTIRLKILLQKLWVLKLSWDELVPQDIKKTWERFVSNAHILVNIKVPRHVLCISPSLIEFHCFVDASQEAYGACIYVRSVDRYNNVQVVLLCAKTRVAPLKPTTIPRLELCGALLGARLAAKVSHSLRCTINRKIFWTDSTVVLGWIRTQPKLLKAFVCNRINEIHELTTRESWRHVPTTLNPADLASRGVDPGQLQGSTVWWNGPDFLLQNEANWPLNINSIDSNLPETKTPTSDCITMTNVAQSPLVNFNNYSKINKLKRTIAYVLRFVNNCRKPENKIIGYLKLEEIGNSFTYLIKLAQSQTYLSEISLLNQGKNLKPKSYLLQLSPFLDDNGVLRVGGRLQNAACEFDKKHPILLDGKHYFTRLLMEGEHLRLLHAGPQLLLSSFREQFWPVGGRTLARSIVRKCVVCTRLRGKTMEPLMGNLPVDRVTPCYPFQVCGVDFAGPFLISSKKGKGNRITKCYLNVIVCFSTKSIHLEIVSDLSTNAFILSLRRFIARRGRPHTIYCDNGTNFVGANNELGRLLRASVNSIYNYTNAEGIKFVFNPPYSPTFGGIWEAGVKSAKFHLKRIMGNASLTYEELGTLFAQIEAVLNSRPLYPLSSDPTDCSPLTPGHFLVGRPLTSLPSPPVTLKAPDRYQRIEQLRQHFWQRWHKEYLAELQQRTKWRLKDRDLKVGDLVVLKEENSPPLKWRLGRVQQLFPGADGVCRVADFYTARGVVRRALNRVCLLPTMEELESETFQGGEEMLNGFNKVAVYFIRYMGKLALSLPKVRYSNLTW